jgi:peptidoglycan hydrolase-like protein with peptidoglycan-binding domain
MKYDKIKRGAVGGLMAVMLMTAMLPAPRAQAATLQELQAQIQVLLAQINALQTQITGGTISNPSTCTPFVTDLMVGRQGVEVTALQRFLINKGHTIPAGATGYFGEQTRSALAQYQAANGIAPAVGYFGPITRAQVNAACVPVTVPPANNSGGNTNNGGVVLKGEGSFERFDVRSGE